MLHACVERFDVTDTVGKNLGTKRGLDQSIELQARNVHHPCMKDETPYVLVVVLEDD